MGTTTHPTDPDSLAVLHTPAREGLSVKNIYNALGGLRNMSGQNVIAAIEGQNARFEASVQTQNAKLDALNAKLDALSAAQKSRWWMLIWMIVSAVALLGALVRSGN